MFVVRVADNFVADEGLASLKFSTLMPGCRLILVLGHTSCGAVQATATAMQDGNALPGHIADLARAMSPGIAPVLHAHGSHLQADAVVANVRHNVERLRMATPILAARVASHELMVVGAVYDLATGKVDLV
jgi:carbonic anhydrase